jgi:hypothetical protein
LRRTAHHLAQLLFAERLHVDLHTGPEQRLVALQGPIEVGAHAHHDAQARVGQRPAQKFREAPPLMLLGARVKLLALIDVVKESRRLRLPELLETGLSRVDQVGKSRLACISLIQPSCRSARSGSVASNCQASRKQSTSALSGSAPGLRVRKHHRLLF